MTERKPPGVGWQSWVDRQIEQGRAEGRFDDLPGTGKPVPGLDGPRDELWWVREKLRREEVQYLPETLRVRKEVEDARERIAAVRTEDEVRSILDEVNRRIRWVNSHVVDGPPSTVVPLDVEATVAAWREAHPASEVADGAPGPAPVGAPVRSSDPPRRRTWWRRIVRRR